MDRHDGDAMHEMGRLRVTLRLLGLAAPDAPRMMVAVLCSLAEVFCTVAGPVIALESVLILAAGGALPLGIKGTFMVLLVLAVVRVVLGFAEVYLSQAVSYRLLADLRSRVFGKLRELAPAKLSGAERGALISTIMADVESLQGFYVDGVVPIITAFGVALVTCCVVGIRWGMDYALVLLVGYLVVGVLIPVCCTRATGGRVPAERQQEARLSSVLLDGLWGLREVIQYDAGQVLMDRIAKGARGLADEQGRLLHAGSAAIAASMCCATLCTVAELVLGAHEIASGLSAAGAVGCGVCALFSFGPFMMISEVGPSLEGCIDAGRRILDLMDEEPSVDENLDGEDVGFTGASVRHVGFSYDGGEKVLSDVSVEIPRGSIVGITGRSGSGKSTLCRLLMRFWDADSGAVVISGTRIEAIRTTSLRAQESYVEQETVLFHSSIRDNLLIAKPDASDEELELACRAASVYDFVASLPEGFDTEVGELGDTLSTGERQRLGLARAFLHDAPLMLLDEPTSNLDSLNEGVILRSLEAQRGTRTVVVVSHRASTVGIADVTYSMDAGRVS